MNWHIQDSEDTNSERGVLWVASYETHKILTFAPDEHGRWKKVFRALYIFYI